MDNLNEQPNNVSEEIQQEPLYIVTPINERAGQVTPSTCNQQTQTDSHLNVHTEIRIENKIVQNENKILRSENELLKRKIELGSKQCAKLNKCNKNAETATGQLRYFDIDEMLQDSYQLKFFTLDLHLPSLCAFGTF